MPRSCKCSVPVFPSKSCTYFSSHLHMPHTLPISFSLFDQPNNIWQHAKLWFCIFYSVRSLAWVYCYKYHWMLNSTHQWRKTVLTCQFWSKEPSLGGQVSPPSAQRSSQ
jgi:hypothetical protein